MLLAIPMLITISPGCNVPADSLPDCELLSIILYKDFPSDSVEVELDNEVLFRGILPIDRVTWQTRDTVSTGDHSIRISLPNRVLVADTVISVITGEIAFEHFVEAHYDEAENKITMGVRIERGGKRKDEFCF